jgi:hypothetical protein
MSLDERERRSRINLNQPFARPVEGLRWQALKREDYDPARLFVWGQMMAVSLLEMLEAVEAKFGREGQKVCTEALVRVGHRLAEEGMEGAERPQGLSDIEAFSLFATWINEQLYASIEKPSIDGPDSASFDILWCPHQDVYDPLDCRVQRYLVEGMMRAAQERMVAAEAGGFGGFNVTCDSTIPAGAPTCHFRIWRAKEGEENAWTAHSRELEERALSEQRGES